MSYINVVETESIQAGTAPIPATATVDLWPSFDPQTPFTLQSTGINNFNALTNQIGLYNGIGVWSQLGLGNLLGLGVDNGGHVDAQPYLESSASFITFNAVFGFLNGTWFYKGSEVSNEPDQTSDITLKKDIEPVKNALDKILELNSISFKWREDLVPQLAEKSTGEIGLSAQEVEKVVPEAVGSTKFKASSESPIIEAKTINYSAITSLLVEAVKEQQEQINALKQTVEELSTKLAECCP